jgi:hypothetical protein
MRHSNQIGIFWQEEISAMWRPLSCQYLTSRDILRLNNVKEMIVAAAVVRECRRVSSFGRSDYYFFRVSARKLTIHFQAPAASLGQYPFRLFGMLR